MLLCLHVLAGKRSLEESFPHHNMVLILLFQLLVTFAYSLAIPSLYKFITTPTELPDELVCSEGGKFWPGLGGSDSDYAWVVISYSLFGMVAAPVAGMLLHRLPFTITIISFSILLVAGGIVYALAGSVWMAFVGYGLTGAGVSFSTITIHTYMGEMGDVMDEIRKKQGKKPRKFLLYNIYSFTMSGGFVLPFLINSVMAEVDISPYHWPGWVLAALSATVASISLIGFVETRSMPQAKAFCPSIACLKMESKLRSRVKNSSCTSYLFLVGCAFLIGACYTIFTSLITPVLSDQFGFSVKYTSYFFVVVSTAYFGSSILQLGAKLAGVGNRNILGLSLVLVLAGCLLFGDWQSIGPDPCTSFSSNATERDCGEVSSAGSGAGDEAFTVGLSAANTTAVQELVEGCQALSGPSNACFWNRRSRVTGDYCTECLGTCLSTERSQNIYQLSLAVILLSIAAPLGFTFVPAIASDITPLNSEVEHCNKLRYSEL
jgi:MFS family permease